MLNRRRLTIGAALLGGLILLILLWRFFFAAPERSALVTAEVVNAPLEQTVEATGMLEPQELVSVGAQVSGRLVTLNVALGQTVHEGDLIGQIDAQTQTNALRTAQAVLANVEAQRASRQATLVQARLDYQRQKMMVAGEATSQASFQAAEATLKSAEADVSSLDAQIRQARVSVSTAEVNLGYTRVSAPMDGVVVAIVTKQGQTVNANQTAPTIVILARLDVMTVKAEVSEADVIKIRSGMPVYFTILGDPDHRYRSRLRQIEPAPEAIVSQVSSASSASSSSSSSNAAQAIYYNALFDVPNDDGRLRAMMTAQVSIVLSAKKKALQIPSTALGERGRGGRYTVRVLGEDGQVHRRKVRIGINNNVTAEVLHGLKQGEKVVVGDSKDATATNNGRRRMGPF